MSNKSQAKQKEQQNIISNNINTEQNEKDYLENIEELLKKHNNSPNNFQNGNQSNFKYNNEQNNDLNTNQSRINTDINFCTSSNNIKLGESQQIIMPSINIVNEHTNINIYNQNSIHTNQQHENHGVRENSKSLTVPTNNVQKIHPQLLNMHNSIISSPRSPKKRQSFRVPEALRIRSQNIKNELKKINESEISLPDSNMKKLTLGQNQMFSFNNVNPYQSILSPKSQSKLRKILDKVKMRCNGVTFFKYTSQKYRYRTFTEQIIQFFNDKSFFSPQHKQTNSFIKKCLPCYNNNQTNYLGIKQNQNIQNEDEKKFIFSYIPVLKPTGTFKNIWNFFQLLIILIGFIYIPLIFGYGINNLYGTQYFQVIIISIFLIDCLICLNTGVYIHGHLRMDRKSILQWYYNHRLAIDLLSNIPLIISLYIKKDNEGSLTQNIMLFLYFLKFSEFTYVRRQFYETFHISKKMRYAIDLIQLVCTILVFSHVYACILIKVSKYEKHHGYDSWTSKIDYINLDKDIGYNLYIYAFYFATVTMCSVGYGDISPVNQLEIIIGTLFMIIACVLFAYFISKIGSILHQLQIESNKTNEMVNLLQIYMNKKNISHQLQQHLREYIEFYYQDHLDDLTKFEVKFKGILSKSLKQDLLAENYAMVTQHPIFHSNFSQQTRNNLIKEIKEMKVIPEQLIYSGNSKSFINSQTLYFVQEGELEIYIQEDDHHQQLFANNKQLKKLQEESHSLKILKKGDCFGAIYFFTGQQQQCNYKIKSKSFGTLLTIDKDSFMGLIEDKPRELEIFSKIRDRIQFSEQYHLVNNKCFACNVETHTCTTCPYVTIKCNKSKIFNNCNKSTFQKRDFFQRNKNILRKVNSRNESLIIKERCQDYLLENIQQIEKIPWIKNLDKLGDSFFNIYSESDEGENLEQSNDTTKYKKLNSIPELETSHNLLSDENTNSNNEDKEENVKVKSQHKIIVKRQNTKNQNKNISNNNNKDNNDNSNNQQNNQPNIIINIQKEPSPNNENSRQNSRQNSLIKNNSQIQNPQKQIKRKQKRNMTTMLTNSERFQQNNKDYQSHINNNSESNLTLSETKLSTKNPKHSLFWHIKNSRENTPSQSQTNIEHNSEMPFDYDYVYETDQQFFIINNFDSMQEFIVYYPKYNYTHILFQFKMIQKFKGKLQISKFGKQAKKKRNDARKFKQLNSLNVSHNNVSQVLLKSNNSFNYNEENQISVIE